MAHETMSPETKQAINALEVKFEYHAQGLNEIKEDIKDLKSNDINHLYEELNNVKIDLNEVKTNVNWLKKYHWMAITASVGAAIAAVVNLVIK